MCVAVNRPDIVYSDCGTHESICCIHGDPILAPEAQMFQPTTLSRKPYHKPQTAGSRLLVVDAVIVYAHSFVYALYQRS